MQLKNKILKEFSTDTISLERLKENIIKELNRLGADNICAANYTISFKNSFWKLGSRGSLMSFLNSGSFDIEQHDKKIVVTFTGFYSMKIELIILLFFICLVILIDPYFCIGCIFIIIGFISKYLSVSEGCNEILSKV